MSEDAHPELNHAQQEEALGGLYLLLARVFSSPPDAQLLEVTRALPSPQADLAFDQIGELLAALATAVDENSSLAALEEDYRRLFVGPDRLMAPPWESVYRSPNRLVFQEQTLEVRRAYLSAGFSHQAMFVEPDDHIALELEFLGLLCQQRAEALRRDDSSRAEDRLRHRASFLREHLLQWVGAFSEDVEKAASTPFWRAVALLLCALAEYDVKRTSFLQGGP